MTTTPTNPEQDSHNRPASRLSPGLLIVILCALMGLLGAGAVLLSNPGSGEAPVSGRPARPLRDWQADDFTLEALDGQTVSLSDYRGRVVFLNFWGTWCEPCKREFPAFAQFMSEQGDDGAIILTVNQGEDAEAVQGFLDEVGVTNVRVLLDKKLDLLDNYPAGNLPATYIIDEEGFVRFTRYGEVSREDLYAYLEDLRS